MFKEEVEEGIRVLEFEVEEEVALRGGELGVDEGSRLEGECVPSDGMAELGWEMVLEEGARVLGLGEGGFEEFVVGLMEGLHGEVCKRMVVMGLEWKMERGCPRCVGRNSRWSDRGISGSSLGWSGFEAYKQGRVYQPSP